VGVENNKCHIHRPEMILGSQFYEDYWGSIVYQKLMVNLFDVFICDSFNGVISSSDCIYSLEL
jgi:hypothetical protein